MARPPSGVPLSPWSRVSDQIGKQVAAGRTAPSADLASIERLLAQKWTLERSAGGNPPKEQVTQEVHNHLGNLYNHAKLAEGGPGPYPVKGLTMLKDELPVQATVEKTTPGKIMEEHVYGDQIGDMIDAISGAGDTGTPNDLTRRFLGGHKAAWDRPAYVFRGDEQNPKANPSPAYSWGGTGAIYISEKHPVVQSYTVEDVLPHEAHHAGSHDGMDRKHNQPYGGSMSEHEAMTIAKKYFTNPDQIKAYAQRLVHGQLWGEMETHFGQLKGIHYGMTGKLVRTPEDNARLLQQILASQHRPISGNKLDDPGLVRAFGDAPTMQYGPKAGQPAVRKNILENLIKDLFPRGAPTEKKDLFHNFNKVMSTAKPNEAPHV